MNMRNRIEDLISPLVWAKTAAKKRSQAVARTFPSWRDENWIARNRIKRITDGSPNEAKYSLANAYRRGPSRKCLPRGMPSEVFRHAANERPEMRREPYRVRNIPESVGAGQGRAGPGSCPTTEGSTAECGGRWEGPLPATDLSSPGQRLDERRGAALLYRCSSAASGGSGSVTPGAFSSSLPCPFWAALPSPLRAWARCPSKREQWAPRHACCRARRCFRFVSSLRATRDAEQQREREKFVEPERGSERRGEETIGGEGRVEWRGVECGEGWDGSRAEQGRGVKEGKNRLSGGGEEKKENDRDVASQRYWCFRIVD
ncbi:hypothetical protein AXG93_1335s1370 [Marchantia polymorpha subsp. ruderalis]|uniref:Uncharacterized protein n=1 Tax=Marchantia polymorpha subsp. ruderalis TaxID=1480154 RepID=A0A176W8B4_MARPO|nr:hypothetical protein AXG93_1335s1370 [Marchantia polymorpha subsp. ruderalis]